MPTIIVVTQEDLQGFSKPGLDLETGLIIELDPAEPVPVQLELLSTDVRGDHNAAAHCRNYLT
ncbi:hypothetical protein [Pseudomonas fluorescens group sp. PF-69]